MAFGRNTRTDNRRSSTSYCSTVTLVVFVALCLLGVWMMTSSQVIPINIFTSDTKPDSGRVTQNNSQFDDGSGDVTEDASRDQVPYDAQGKKPGITTEEKVQDTEDQNLARGFKDEKGGPHDASKGEMFFNENGRTEDGGIVNGRKGEVVEKSEKQTKIVEQRQGDNIKKTLGITSKDVQDMLEEKVQETERKDEEQKYDEKNDKKKSSTEMIPDGSQSEILNETGTQTRSWSTQAAESRKEKEAQKSSKGQILGYNWRFCNTSAGADYVPCLDNTEAIMKLHSTKHYEHRERHCPEENPVCLVPLPEGYKQPIKWPKSRDKIWYANVPHTKLAAVKGHQNWVKVSGKHLTFPGGGTQFKNGALHYIDFIQESLPDIAWGKQSRVILDVGCGVASFGGYLFERDALTMSFAPKDEHEAQVQFALERGIPAISAVMGTKRLPFPGRVFDVVHCARCRVPWHIEGGMLLLELNRLLRPGGYFVWSATPVYRKGAEDVEIWKAMSQLRKSICWDMLTITKDSLNAVGVAIYRKPTSNECYNKRVKDDPPLCKKTDDPNAAWNVPLQACIHRVPVDPAERGSQWPEQWPKRLETAPYWLNSSQLGVYGRPAPEDFQSDYDHWKRVLAKSYFRGMGINWSTVRNVMDMRSVYGGFAAALTDMKVWIMNVVSIDSADTLPVIYERGLFGIYHDWCESFSSYPRTYDLLHADHLFSRTKTRCKLLSVMAEVDRLLRPEGKLIVRDDVETINEVETMARSLQWSVRWTDSKDKEGLLCVEKTMWRPTEAEMSM